MPSYLNRLAVNIEQKVKECLTKSFKFDDEALAQSSGKRLIQEVCKAVYANTEFQQQRYLIHSFDICKVIQDIILKRF